MFILSAFADEISPNPTEQISVLQSCQIGFIELRSVYSTNILSLSGQQLKDLKQLLDKEGIKISAIGSPIGKIRIDEPFAPHLEKFQHAIDVCALFETKNMRIFSYYPPEGFQGDWHPWRNAVLDRMHTKAYFAAKAGIQLFHENEHRIYGDSPERIEDLFANVRYPHFRAAFDAANFVYGGFDPLLGWKASKPYLAHLHFKDWRDGAEHGSLIGDGDGQWPLILKELVEEKYHGFAVLEPHLLGGGPTGGATGPDKFPQAVQAARSLLAKLGAEVQ